MNIDKFSLLKITLMVLLFLGFIIGWLGFGERGFIHLYRKEKERQAYLKKINQLEKDNQELLEEIGDFHRETEQHIAGLADTLRLGRV